MSPCQWRGTWDLSWHNAGPNELRGTVCSTRPATYLQKEDPANVYLQAAVGLKSCFERWCSDVLFPSSEVPVIVNVPGKRRCMWLSYTFALLFTLRSPSGSTVLQTRAGCTIAWRYPGATIAYDSFKDLQNVLQVYGVCQASIVQERDGIRAIYTCHSCTKAIKTCHTAVEMLDVVFVEKPNNFSGEATPRLIRSALRSEHYLHENMQSRRVA